MIIQILNDVASSDTVWLLSTNAINHHEDYKVENELGLDVNNSSMYVH